MNERLRIGLLLAVVMLVYGNALRNEFTLDDGPYIVNNQPAMSRKYRIRNPMSRLTQRGSPMTRRSRHPAL